jgi:hypothetical protein
MTTKRDTRRSTRLPAAVAAMLLLVAAGAGSAAAAPAASQTPTNTCWQQVVNDWLDHQPNVVGTYPIACYTQAIQHLSAYPDVQQYSSAMDDIHRALLAAIRQDRGNGPPGLGGGGGGGSNPAGPTSSGDGSGPTADGRHTGFISSLSKAIGPGNATSIPLPLLVLGGLALLLLLAAVGTWLARRVQARRVTPAPAHAPRPPR